VAEWQTKLVESLPKNLRGNLPTIEEIEQELTPSAKVEAAKPRRKPAKPARKKT
jgi:hypothetical protein